MAVADPQPYNDPLFAWCPPADQAQTVRTPTAEAVRQACRDLAQDLPSEFLAIVRVLESHVGESRAIAAPDIAQLAGLYDQLGRANRGTKVRHVLSVNLELLPWPLCGDSEGFYFAATAAELTHYAANLRSRWVEMFRRAVTTRRMAVRTGRFVHLGRGRFVDVPPAGGR